MKKPIEKYKEFVFEDYLFERDNGVLSLRYSFDDQLFFEEKLVFPVEGIDWTKVNFSALKNALDALHIMFGISYYKAYLPRKMVLKKTLLDYESALFWKRIYERGLGEFFYKNDINFDSLINFPFTEKEKHNKDEIFSNALLNSDEKKSSIDEMNDSIQENIFISSQKLDLRKRALLPMGGGKDSILSALITEESKVDYTPFSLRADLPIQETARILKKNILTVDRKLDAKLFELNELGAYNGHVPITAMISFLSVFCSILYDYRYIVFSLEKSADFGQFYFNGMEINHQYSKSEEFEIDLRDYISKNISPDIDYFSLLRPLYELKIAEMLSSNKQFDDFTEVFSSCNSNFKINKDEKESSSKWCGSCPKCAFVYAIFSPFLTKEKLKCIFGKNVFEDEKLENLFLELTGYKNFKPFECVGTPEETICALYLASKKEYFKNDHIIKIFKDTILPDLRNPEVLVKEVLTLDKASKIPEPFKSALKKFAR